MAKQRANDLNKAINGPNGLATAYFYFPTLVAGVDRAPAGHRVVRRALQRGSRFQNALRDRVILITVSDGKKSEQCLLQICSADIMR